MARAQQGDWVAGTADLVLAEQEIHRPGRPVVCASGISPSGPIHLGNLREIMVPHMVSEEIRGRGAECVHILSWDDYDRLRKVPAEVPDSFAEHIGRPLSRVPDPCGEHASWAEHFKAPFRAALTELGVDVLEISQTERYTTGVYRERVLHALNHREAIDEVLQRYRTKEHPVDVDGSDDGTTVSSGYYPYKPYCAQCARDTTTVITFDPATSSLEYVCDCGHRETVRLTETHQGKLVWKVDWPMRWAFEGVSFEAGGVDHSSPGSSYVVGSQLVREVFGGEPPVYLPYSFVGTTGMAKMSGSAGGAPTPADALAILEAPLLRWLYVRRKPNQSFTVAFDQEVGRIYDEWDALASRVAAGTAEAREAQAYDRSVTTSVGPLSQTPRPVPFRTLASIVDITAGDVGQTLRIVRDMGSAIDDLEPLQPRLDKATTWVRRYLDASERTHILAEPDKGRLDGLDPTQRQAIELVLAGLDRSWSPEGLTALVYSVPKIQLGLPVDTSATPELKARQREFFVLLYELLVGRDTGPRLPTLLLALGRERVRRLLGGGDGEASQQA